MSDYQPTIPERNVNVAFLTYQDCVEELLDWAGDSDNSGRSRRIALRAVDEAYRELWQVHNWKYYQRRFQVTTSAKYTTGTVAFDLTGGTYERELTLTDGTWPSDAAHGTIVLSNVHYTVSERKSSTVLTLREDSCPTADVASGTSYTWYRDTYPLPTDFSNSGDVICSTDGDVLRSVSLEQFNAASRDRGSFITTNPSYYAIGRDERRGGVMSIFFGGGPATAKTYDMAGRTIPSGLSVESYQTGTAAITAGVATVTGTSTVFASNHIGCVFRISSTASKPTSLSGYVDGSLQPFAEERIIQSVESGTSLTLDSATVDSYSGCGYTISSVVDIHIGIMGNVFRDLCRLKYSQAQRDYDGEVRRGLQKAYQYSLAFAQQSDATFTGVNNWLWETAARGITVGEVTPA